MGKQKTHEQYVSELKTVNPNLVVKEGYQQAATKILHQCSICGHEWYAFPLNTLRGEGCPKCATRIRANKRRKSHEQYVQELQVIQPNIIVLEQYYNAKTKILHKCNICECEWQAIPNSILQGKGCPKCGNRIKKTHEQYLQEVLNRNSKIQVAEKYINGDTKILHKCMVCGCEWSAKPVDILQGKGCPVCSGHMVVQGINDLYTTHPHLIKEWDYKKNINLSPFQVSAGSGKKVWWKCNECGHEWEAFVYNRTGIGKGCPECGKQSSIKSRTKTHDKYVKEVADLNSNIEVIGIYTTANIKVLHKCKIDGYEWLASPHSILQGTGCPICNASHGEMEIKKYLEKNHLHFVQQKTFPGCKNIKMLPFDFYLSDYNICIEFDGIQHFEPIEIFGGEEALIKQQNNDAIKNNYCHTNNINLLRIKYDENIVEKLDNFMQKYTDVELAAS